MRDLEKEQLKQQGAIENTRTSKAADIEKEMAKQMFADLQNMGN